MDNDSRGNLNKKPGIFSGIIKLIFWVGLAILAYFAYQHFFTDQQNKEGISNQEVRGQETARVIEVETIKISSTPLSRIDFQKVGTVTPYKSATLTSEASGILRNFKFEEGDFVQKDGKIAEISDSVGTEIAKINYDNALTTYENSKKSYKNTLDSVEQDAKMALIGIESAELNYENSIKVYGNLEKSIEEQTRSAKIGLQGAQLALQKAQENYFNTYATTGINLNNTVENSLSGVNSAFILIKSSIDAVENLISSEPSYSNELRYHSDYIYDDYTYLRNEYKYVSEAKNANYALDLLEKTLKLTNDTQNMLNRANDIIDKSDNKQDLGTFKSSFNNLISSLDQSKNGLHMSKQGLYSASIGSQLQPEGSMTNVEIAQQQVVAALQQLKQLEEAGKAQLDGARHAINLAAKQIDSAKTQHSNVIAKGNLQKIGVENQVSSVEGQVKIAKANLGGTTIKAPFDGIITEKFLDEGNYANPSQRILTIANLDKVYVTVSLTAEELTFVKLGQKVTIKAPGGIEKEGQINKVLPTVDPASKQIKIQVLINNKDSKLISGMFADVFFIDAKSESIGISIPFKSVFFEQNRPYVYVVKNNKALKTEIELGDTKGNEVEIKNGLFQDDEIITTGAKTVKDGDIVTSKTD